MKRITRLIAINFTLIVLTTSCKKELPNKYEIFEGQTKQNDLPQDADSSIVYFDNTLLIDTSNYILESTPEMLEEGVFTFSSTDSIGMNIKVGDVFLYQGNGGYLREVTSISKSKRDFTIKTKSSTLSKFFEEANLSFQDAKTSVSFPMNDYKIYENGSEHIAISGELAFETGFDWKLDYDDGLKYLKFKTTDAQMSLNGTIAYELSSGFDLNNEKVIFSKKKTSFIPVYGIPLIPVVTTFELVAKLEGSLASSLKSSVNTNFSTPLEQGYSILW